MKCELRPYKMCHNNRKKNQTGYRNLNHHFIWCIRPRLEENPIHCEEKHADILRSPCCVCHRDSTCILTMSSYLLFERFLELTELL